MSTISKTETLWEVALNCALNRSKKICKNRFDSAACYNCSHYLYKYAPDASSEQVNLMMYKADGQAYGIKLDDHSGIKIIVWVAVILTILVLAMRCNNGIDDFGWIRQAISDNSIPQQVHDAESHEQFIWDTLEHVGKEINKRGVADDKYICRIATQLFYELYPVPDAVRPMSTLIDGNKGHSFIQVRVNGKWIDVEPQAYDERNTYDMATIWGDRYKPRHNRNISKEVTR